MKTKTLKGKLHYYYLSFSLVIIIFVSLIILGAFFITSQTVKNSNEILQGNIDAKTYNTMRYSVNFEIKENTSERAEILNEYILLDKETNSDILDKDNNFISSSLLSNIKKSLSDFKYNNAGEAFIISTSYEIILSSSKNYKKGDNLQNLIGKKIETSKAYLTRTEQDKTIKYIASSPIKTGGLILCIAIPESKLYESANTIHNEIDKYADENSKAMSRMWSILFIILFVSLLLIIFSVIIFANKISTKITDPIKKLSSKVSKISKGNFDEKITINSGDEIEDLANSFNTMTDELKDYIKEIQDITSQKEKTEAELNAAKTIQKGMLPTVFPPFPNRREFDIYAFINPAKEVGGDFYDFFTLGENKIAIVIADVSGKGIPAALFMVISKTLLKNEAEALTSLETVFKNTNESLSESNDASMFVTCFFGIFDLETSTLEYINAGHNPPALIRDGHAEFIKLLPGPPLAAAENITWKKSEMKLQKGDKLFLYTDGVTEALNDKIEQFGEKRLLESLAKNSKEKSIQEEVKNTYNDILNFTKNEEQFDDITMLLFSYKDRDSKKGEKISESYILDAKKENLETINKRISEFIKNNLTQSINTMEIELAIEEVFVNIANYAYDDTGEVELTLELSSDNKFKIIFEDSGKEFDPTKITEPDISKPAEDREIGGLGIFLTKKIMDKVSYKRENGKNILTLEKTLI